MTLPTWSGDPEMINGHTNKQLHRRLFVATADEIRDDPPNTQNRPRRKGKGKPPIRISIHSLYFCTLFFLSILLVSYFKFVSSSLYYDTDAISTPSSTDLSEFLPLNDPISSFQDEWPPIIHIVNTRFMQEQGPLKTLGMARYLQFMTFCFPSVIHQTSQHFLWIIKTDPQLSPDLLNLMIQALKPYSNFYLVASNNNFMIYKKNGSWRNGAEGYDLLKSKIYTGNVTKLHQAIALRNDRPVLETRLDADDGFHQMYVQYLQTAAIDRFKKTESMNSPDWLYWCIRRHLEWHTPNDNVTDPDVRNRGILLPIQHNKLCITPGMTVGYNLGVESNQVPVYPHDVLYKQLSQRDTNNETIHSCYAPGKTVAASDEEEKPLPCLDMAEEFLLGAIRSRTWTSAGMNRVDAAGQIGPSRVVKKMWRLLKERFGVQPERVQELLEYLENNRQQIARENLVGQCTTGHSCKDKAKEELQRYMQS